MNVAAVLALLTALFKAFPAMRKFYEDLQKAYKVQQDKAVVAANHEAVKDAIEQQDQRGLEDEAHSGKPSGVGTIRTSLPNIVHKP
jgi:hypothetical protein